jgi:hypothetical protein
MTPPSKSHAWLHVVAPLLVAAAVCLLYLRTDNQGLSDPIWAPHVAASVIYDGDPFLDEFQSWVEAFDGFATLRRDDHIHPFFPLGGPLLTIPALLVMDAVMPQLQGVTLQEFLVDHPPADPAVMQIQQISASLLTALSAGIMYLVAREYLSVPYALLLTATYAFATSAYSTASRFLWQHGPSMLMLSIALLLLIRARKRPGLIPCVALPLAAAYIIRPTNSLSVIVVTVYVFLYYRRYLLRYLLLAALLAVPFIWANLQLYGSILPPYFATNRLGLPPTLGVALLGNLVSPGRGLLVFSPIFILAPVGIAMRARHRLGPLEGIAVAIIALHWFTISAFGHWTGGHSFGPRLFADILPFGAFLLIPYLEAIETPGRSLAGRTALLGVYGLLFIAGVAIHHRGAASPAVAGWNTVPVNVDAAQWRVWDWTDVQFLRGLGDALIVARPAQLVVNPDAQPSAGASAFEIISITDVPVEVSVILPDHVVFAEHSAWLFHLDPLPGGGMVGQLIEPLLDAEALRLEVVVDAPTVAGPTSLGGIYLAARRAGQDGDERGHAQVIALSTDADQTDRPVLPHDVTLTCVDPAAGELYALFGAGWYGEEGDDDATWRWAGSPAYLYIWSDRERPATLTLAISSLHASDTADGLGEAGVFHITLPDGQTTVAAGTNQPSQFTAALRRGWNTVVLELEAGNFRPADLGLGSDVRNLSFSLDAITLSGECAQP